ncbi:hypothetical protein LB507_011698 [Fusarium sp. FIESC RH6]|nr:hypothetical protein LB507_011698 [Fusarium sp. FIESC RH6]
MLDPDVFASNRLFGTGSGHNFASVGDSLPRDRGFSDKPMNKNLVTGPSLDHTAAKSLQAASSIAAPQTEPDIPISTGRRSFHDQSPATGIDTAQYTSGNGDGSPSLPSLRSALGELRDLATEHLPEQDFGCVPSGPSTISPPSPAGNIGHRFSVSTLPSSAHSPKKDNGTISLHSTPSASTHAYTTNSTPPRARPEYSSSNAGDTPTIDRSASKPATPTSINSAPSIDRMSVDSNTHPQPISGSYTCTVQGCNDAPFQTQYLLNSHMIKHSSARPHYCPVKGCPRSQGGKGFKRKNEVTRHGLVHGSPGYVCPFCPDREHKYPRPDNLQRHVRAHHVDKDKHDPQLRNVLAQRPDGPNRGRRQRRPPQ